MQHRQAVFGRAGVNRIGVQRCFPHLVGVFRQVRKVRAELGLFDHISARKLFRRISEETFSQFRTGVRLNALPIGRL